jgi:pimeloyl-ACP methyl ester carboxylesterase
MTEALPTVLVPGLNCSARLYAEQIPALWRFGPVTVADHTRDDSMAAIARRILAAAPPRFALAGLSMGGYIAFEIMRQSPQRVAKLALLDTWARAETPEQTKGRLPRIELAKRGRIAEAADIQFPQLVHRDRHGDEALKRLVRTMAEETGAAAFLRQQQAIMTRPDSRAGLAAISCPTLVLVGDSDELTTPASAREIAAGIGGSRLVVIPQCGHLSTIERPEAVTQALVEWMRS